MAIVWRKAPGVFLNSLYDTLKVLETPKPADRLHLQSSKLNTPTIGIGFDLKSKGSASHFFLNNHATSPTH